MSLLCFVERAKAVRANHQPPLGAVHSYLAPGEVRHEAAVRRPFRETNVVTVLRPFTANLAALRHFSSSLNSTVQTKIAEIPATKYYHTFSHLANP
jgi:hypothetical protein